MRYLPLLLLVLAGNVSAQLDALLKTPDSDYLLLSVDRLAGCAERFDVQEITELAEGELLRARLKNDYPGLDAKGGVNDIIWLRIEIVCLDLGAVAFFFAYERRWPNHRNKVAVLDHMSVAFSRNDDAYILNGIRSHLSEFLNFYLRANQE